MAGPDRLTTRRKLAFGLVATVLAFALIEGGLRVAGEVYIARYQHRVEAGLAGSTGQLWAFGDSFTLGVGADDPARDSYPAVAARLLSQTRSGPLHLSNRARPGLNSTEIVAEFESA